MYMYIAPGQGHTVPWSQKSFKNTKLLLICYFLQIYPILNTL